MTKIKTVKAWAVVEPEGTILHVDGIGEERGEKEFVKLNFMGLTSKTLWELQENLKQWEKWEAIGYRCIPVTITPEGE